jgi:hypothetical protein
MIQSDVVMGTFSVRRKVVPEKRRNKHREAEGRRPLPMVVFMGTASRCASD